MVYILDLWKKLVKSSIDGCFDIHKGEFVNIKFSTFLTVAS